LRVGHCSKGCSRSRARSAWQRDGMARDETAWTWWTLPPAISGCLAQRSASASRSLPVRAGLAGTCGAQGQAGAASGLSWHPAAKSAGHVEYQVRLAGRVLETLLVQGDEAVGVQFQDQGPALGLPVAPLKSSALRDWETRVTRKGDVPCGARAAEVGGAPPCLVELPMPAGSAEPWLRTQLQPRSIRRPFRHETQNMPLCWPRLSRALLAPLTTPARTSGGRPAPPPKTPRRFRRAVSLLLVQGVSAPGGVMSRRIPGRRMRRPGILGARCRGATRHLGPLLSGCTVRPRRTR
jgi:hypothetical protein